MNTNAAWGPSAQTLLGLTLAVLVTHLAILQSTALSLDASPTSATPPKAFVTRMLAPEPPEPPAPTPRAEPPALAPAKIVTARAQAAPPVAPALVAAAPATALVSPPEVASPAAAKPASEAEPVVLASVPETSTPALSTTAFPGSMLLRYTVKSNKFPYRLNAELRWEQNGESYATELAYSALGQSRMQTSRGDLGPLGLAPQRFEDKASSEVSARFDHEKGIVTFSANTPDVVLQPGAQDRLSVLIQLGAMVANAPAHFPASTTVALQTIGPRDATTWRFVVQSRETLSLPGGALATLKLMRKPRPDDDQQVELWLAPALGYLPARIRITEKNGDYVDQQWLATDLPV